MKRLLINIIVLAGLLSCGHKPSDKISIFSAHISTIAQQEGLSFTEAASKVKDLGYKGVDVFVFIEPDNLRILDSLGFEHACAVTFFDLTASNLSEMENLSLSFVKEHSFDKLMLVPMADADKHIPADEIYRRIDAFVKRAATQNTRIVFEDCDNDAFCNDLKSLEQLYEHVPGIGHAFDTGNYLYFGDDCLEAFGKLRDKIEHVHLKDRYSPENMASVACFTGCIPQEQIVRELMRSGYDGWYTVEIYNSPHMLADVALSIANLRNVLSGKPAPTPVKKDIGLQLYSVKGLEGDFEGAMKKLAGTGITSLEISNYNLGEPLFGYTPEGLKNCISSYGLQLKSSNAKGAGFDIDHEQACLDAWRQVFADHRAMGCKYFAMTGNMIWKDMEKTARICVLMNKIGHLAGEYGIRFLYHNHNQEFHPLAGSDTSAYDYLLAHTDPAAVNFELDVYWAMQGKRDPTEMLRQHPGRFPVLHVKDYYVLGESGKLDFEAIFNAFYEQGGEDYFIEMEDEVSPERADYIAGIMYNITDYLDKLDKLQQGIPEADAGPAPDQVEKSLRDITCSVNYLRSAPYVK